MRSVPTVGARALLAATAFALVVAGCGGSSSETTTAAPTTAAPSATTAAPASETTTTTAAPAETTAPPEETTSAPGDDDQFARGEDLFQTSAGGVGCASCHGKEARGDVGVGPNIQGKQVSDIKLQLDENELMEYMKSVLTAEDIEAVVVYLKYLEDEYGPG